MTSTEFASNFRLLCDKVGSPYFIDAEINQFINQAQLSVIDELLFPKRKNQERKDSDVYGFDNQSNAMQGLQPLVKFSSVAIATKTSVVISVLETAAGANVYRVINVILPNDVLSGLPLYNARYVPTIRTSMAVYGGLRYGNPTTPKTGIYSIEDGVINFLPSIVVNEEIGVEFIRTPLPFSIAASVTCEVDVIWHNEILYRSLQLAGISIREQFFYEAMSIEKQKES